MVCQQQKGCKRDLPLCHAVNIKEFIIFIHRGMIVNGVTFILKANEISQCIRTMNKFCQGDLVENRIPISAWTYVNGYPARLKVIPAKSSLLIVETNRTYYYIKFFYDNQIYIYINNNYWNFVLRKIECA